MKERPIIFSGPMVRAILEGRKTQTRRITKVPSGFSWDNEAEGLITDGKCVLHLEEIKCPYGTVGDRLWVRETCCSDGWSVHYTADNNYQEFGETRYEDVLKLHHYAGGFSKQVPSIHMPRWASRIDLEITGIRVERVQEISEQDAIAEGIKQYSNFTFGLDEPSCCMGPTAVLAYMRLFDFINGEDSWSANPWVWVIDFRRVQQ